jgi:hypothetical protein
MNNSLLHSGRFWFSPPWRQKPRPSAPAPHAFFLLSMVEWNAPPLRFKRLGAPSAYVNWARLSLFSTGLFTNLASGAGRGVYGNLGAQLDFRIVLFTYLNSTFSAGYAVATDRHGRRSTEYMVSLRLL